MNNLNSHDIKWITGGASEGAVYFFTTFECPNPQGTRIAICGLGLYELLINGQKVGNQELSPTASVYDRRTFFNTFDLSSYLVPGLNAIGVIVSNGLYNPVHTDVWHFDLATWRDAQKLALEIRDAQDQVLLVSSPTTWWCSKEGPITYSQLRGGEKYDARKEFAHFATTEFSPDARWTRPTLTASPGGILTHETANPIRVTKTFEVTAQPNVFQVYDIGTNISGRCRITVEGGLPGDTVDLTYGEMLKPYGDLSMEEINCFVKTDLFQHEVYTVKGEGSAEVWESHFTYHGFQYVRVITTGSAKVTKLEARQLNSDFTSVGSFTCSHPDLNTLQAITRVSYLANFVGIPTDCPHREKNGWTGDAQLACETGLHNFDSASTYAQWLLTLQDCQRPNGALPGIAPSAGNGFSYNWGNGPNWDGALFEIPYQIWLFTGDSSPIRTHYDAMRKYLEYCDSMAIEDNIQFGLGDWVQPFVAKRPDPFFSTTAAYYGLLKRFISFATLLEKTADVAHFTQRADRVKQHFNQQYYQGNGIYENGCLTALATPLYYGLCDPTEEMAVLKTLVTRVEQDDSKALFGILGAKMVPRVLADYGYADLALRFFTQEAYPGWVNWLRQGAVSLWENWEGHGSRNHIMFGDLSAWFYRYAAGFRHLPDTPGFQHLAIEPENLAALSFVTASYRGYTVHWERTGSQFDLTVTIPEGCTASIKLPGGTSAPYSAGTHHLSTSL